MDTTNGSVFGTELMLAMVMAAFAVFSAKATAQEEDLMPAVDASAYRDAASEAEPEPEEADTAVIAPSVSRDTSGAQVMDSIELSRTEITGNQELPKVLYIVPWKKSDPGDLMGRPVNTLLDEVLAPIDREEFVRQIDYYNDLAGNDE